MHKPYVDSTLLANFVMQTLILFRMNGSDGDFAKVEEKHVSISLYVYYG